MASAEAPCSVLRLQRLPPCDLTRVRPLRSHLDLSALAALADEGLERANVNGGFVRQPPKPHARNLGCILKRWRVRSVPRSLFTSDLFVKPLVDQRTIMAVVYFAVASRTDPRH